MQRRIICTVLVMAFGVTAASDYHLVILHQNDLHSRYGLVDQWGSPCREMAYQIDQNVTCFGGFAQTVAYIESIRGDPYNPNTLVMNAGDFFQGDAMHMLFKWEVAAAMAKHIPFNAMAIGDKDFNEGIDGLLPFMRVMGPNVFICTNMDFSALNETLRKELEETCPRHRIITVGQKKIGVLGYLLPDAQINSHTGDIIFEDEIRALTREVKVLRKKGVKILIALGHSGYERDREIARRVPSLDVIVGGHSHSLLWPDFFSETEAGMPPDAQDVQFLTGPYPTVVMQPSGRRVLVVHAYKVGRYVGNINITFNHDDEVKEWWSQPVLIRPTMPADEEAKKTVDEFFGRLHNESMQPIGQSLVQLIGLHETCSRKECNLGNFLADAYIRALRLNIDRKISHKGQALIPTIAFVNSGQIVASLPMGNITLSDLDAVLPFRNAVEVITVTGRAIMHALQNSLSNLFREQHDGRFMQFAGARVVYDAQDGPVGRVVSCHLLCNICPIPKYQLVNESQLYQIAVSTFVANGGYDYNMFSKPLERKRYGLLDLFVLASYLRQMSPVHPAVEGRIQFKTNSTVQRVSKPSAGRQAASPIFLVLLCSATVVCFSSD